MTKKKDSVALFEVITKDREKYPKGGVAVPGWMGGAPHKPGVHPEQGAPQGPSVPQDQLAPEVPAALASEPAAPPSRPETGEPMLSISGGRIRLSLNYTVSLVAAFALVVVLFGAVALGRLTAGAGRPAGESGGNLPGILDAGKGEGEQRKAPAPKAPQAGQKTVPAKAQTPAAPATRIVGKYYLVIQTLRGGLTTELEKEAFKIRDFCVANGKPADVQEQNGNYIVWSLTPLDSPSAKDPKVQQYAQEIEELGRKYASQGGRYNLMQRRSAGGPLDPFVMIYMPKKTQ